MTEEQSLLGADMGQTQTPDIDPGDVLQPAPAELVTVAASDGLASRNL